MSLLGELKRRNVIRMAGLYLVAAWLVTQVAGTLLPMFDAPAWIARTVVVILAIAFIPALVVAWVFELTPQGLRRDEGALANVPAPSQTARGMDRAIMIVLAIALLFFGVDRFVLAPRRDSELIAQTKLQLAAQAHEELAKVSERSIAVLPFQNLAADKENAFFVEGIQDEILTRLAKIGSLRVISRISTQQYGANSESVAKIAERLGVANVLEGSVQKSGDTVHINVQLIRAGSDESLWAETYNRKLDDIFAVQAELAQTVAETLHAHLTGAEKQQLAARPTANQAAYEAFLRGLAFEVRRDTLPANVPSAIEAFTKAVELDPDFALAWAHLSREHSFAYNNVESTQMHDDAATSALSMAKQLDPALAETRFAEAFYAYWVKRDYEDSQHRFEALQRTSPNDAAIPYALAAIARRRGDWHASQILFAQALELSPMDLYMLLDAVFTDIALRDVQTATAHINRALGISPKNMAVLNVQIEALLLSADITESRKLLKQMPADDADPNLVYTYALVALLSRDYAPAIALLEKQLANPALFGNTLWNLQNTLGDLQRLSGDADGAAASYRAAKATIEASLRDQPENPWLVSALAWSLAGLGEREAALDEAQHAIDLMPTWKDALVGPVSEEILTRIQARFGLHQEAIAGIRRLLGVAYGTLPLTVALLRIDPDWDALRDDAGFKALLQTPVSLNGQPK
jgi:TolB-like protein/Tfp pilus assembly protein PilF